MTIYFWRNEPKTQTAIHPGHDNNLAHCWYSELRFFVSVDSHPCDFVGGPPSAAHPRAIWLIPTGLWTWLAMPEVQPRWNTRAFRRTQITPKKLGRRVTPKEPIVWTCTHPEWFQKKCQLVEVFRKLAWPKLPLKASQPSLFAKLAGKFVA